MPGLSLQSDFTAGELSPSLSARVELAKYGKGCRTLRNFLVQAHGGATKRPGFELLDELPGPAALVPFVFNQAQAYCLCFGEGWLRVAAHDGFILNEDGGVYQIDSPYTLEQARRLSHAQSADVLFIACHGVPPHKLKRLGHDHWEFEAMRFTAPLPAPKWPTGDGGFTQAYAAYKISDKSPLQHGEGSWGGINWKNKNGTLISLNLYTEVGGEYVRFRPGQRLYYYSGGSSTQWRYSASDSANPFFAFPLYQEVTPAALFVNDAKKSDGSVSKAQLTAPYTYHVTAVDADGKESELSEGVGITGPASNNWQGGDYIALRWLPVDGAAEYRVYKSSFGGRPAYAASTGETAWNDYNTLPSLSEGAPAYEDPFPEGDYPGAVCLFEQRLVFASSPNRPQTIWMSKTGDYGNFAVYAPLGADSPLELTIASQEVSAANWLVALRTLILGTSDMEWEIAGRGDGAFSAMNKKVTPQSYWGSSLKRAMIIGNIILHVSSSGSQVRSLQYEFAADSYGGSDLSIMAAHLLERERIVDWTYQKNPDSIIWAVRGDGILLGLTYQAEHQIAAWHRHDTAGKFLAVCSIPHGHESSLFAVVERDGVHYLERMAGRYQGGDPAGAVFLDCSLTYAGEAARTISGLEHLEGKSVGILADGAVMAPRPVRGGRIELDHPASLVTVGLPYTADLETMPVEVVGAEGASVGLKKQIHAVSFIFRDSLGVKAGLSFEALHDVKWRVDEPYGTPPAPFSGVKQVTAGKLPENVLTVCLRSDSPTPVTLLALVSHLEVKAR